jgi:hypothetical protein
MKDEDATSNTYDVSDTDDSADLESYQTIGYPTSTDVGLIESYFRMLPKNIDIFRTARIEALAIEDSAVRTYTIDFLLAFQRVIVDMYNTTDIASYLPPLVLNVIEDGSSILEWIFKDFRIGFSIEPRLEESSWYLVSNANLDEASASGLLERANNDALLTKLTSFVLQNT